MPSSLNKRARLKLLFKTIEVLMPRRSLTNRKKSFQVILSVIFLVCFCNSAFPQDNSNNYTIELESEGAYPFNAGDSKQTVKTMALFKAKRAAVELAGKYFRRKKLIEAYEHKKDEVYNILADEIRKNVLKQKWISASTSSKYVVKITIKIDVADFIRAEIVNLKYEKEEAKETFRKKLEPTIDKDIIPGHDLAKAYRLIRKAQLRPAIIYLDRLEMKYPNWDDIHLAKSLAYYAMNEFEAMEKALKRACQLGAEEACYDLEKIKRLHEHDFSL